MFDCLFVFIVAEASVLSFPLLGRFFNPSLAVDLLVELLFSFQNSNIGEAQRALVVKQVTEGYATELIEVSIVKEHVAPGELAITAGSSDLLDVVLYAPGQIIVDD